MFSHQVYAAKGINDWVIAFYGFGQSAFIYEPLYELIKHKKNLLVINNPSLDYSNDIYPEDFANYLKGTLAELNIDKFQSVSYSMGSRMNLFLPLYCPKLLSKIILIAPDGIGVNVWNRIAVHTKLGRSIFRFFVEKDNVYLRLLQLLYNVRILNKSLFAFSKWNMRDKTQRRKVYNAWMNMRYIIPDLKTVNNVVEQYEINLISYFGKEDVVIPPRIYRKCKRSFPGAKHNLINRDHNFLKLDFFKLLAQELL